MHCTDATAWPARTEHVMVRSLKTPGSFPDKTWESISHCSWWEQILSSPEPETFFHFKNITILSLNNCGSNGTFPHKIFNIGTLSVIDTSWNNNLHGFMPEFPSSRSLYSLSVSSTNLSGEIPSFIGNMRKLSELNLSKCGFSRTISNSPSNLTKLVQIDLSYNFFLLGGFLHPFLHSHHCKQFNFQKMSLVNWMKWWIWHPLD